MCRVLYVIPALRNVPHMLEKNKLKETIEVKVASEVNQVRQWLSQLLKGQHWLGQFMNSQYKWQYLSWGMGFAQSSLQQPGANPEQRGH